jgi:hypothetical protein
MTLHHWILHRGLMILIIDIDLEVQEAEQKGYGRRFYEYGKSFYPFNRQQQEQ